MKNAVSVEPVQEAVPAAVPEKKPDDSWNFKKIVSTASDVMSPTGLPTMIGKAVFGSPVQKLTDYVSENNTLGIGKFVQHSSPEADALKEQRGDLVTEQIARAAPEVLSALGSEKGKEIYESLTGRAFYTEEELNEVENDKLRSQLKNQQETILTNVGGDLMDLYRGVVAAVPLAAKGTLASVKEGWEQSGIAGALIKPQLDAAKVAAGLTLEGLRSIEETSQDPSGRFLDEPLIAALDAAQAHGAGVVASLPGTISQRVAGAVGELTPLSVVMGRNAKALNAAQDLRPTVALKDAVDVSAQAVDKVAGLDAGSAASQLLLDARAGVPGDILNLVDNFRTGKKARTQTALLELDEMLQKIPVAERGFARDVLAAEETRLISPNWPDRVPALKASLSKVIRKGVLDEATARILLDEQPALVDELVAQHAGKSGDAAQDAALISNALKHRVIDVVDEASGENIGALSFMLFGHKLDPSKLKISVNATSPFAVRALALRDELEGIRQLYVRIGNEANGINVGQIVNEGSGMVLKDRSLLPMDVMNKHQAYYMPDVLKGSSALPHGTASIIGDLAESNASPFAASHFKNKLPFQERLKIGAEDDLERALKMSVQQSVSEIERYKLFENLSKLDSVLDNAAFRELSKTSPDLAKRYVKVPLENRPNIGLPVYGALSGKYVPPSALRFLKNMQMIEADAGKFLKFVRRFRSAWSTAKVVDNLPSWMNNVTGNVMHNLMDGGIIGTGEYLGTLSRQIGDALPGKKSLPSDPYYQAALRNGIIDQAQLPEVGELGSLRQHLKTSSSPLEAIQKYLKDVPARAKTAIQTQGAEAALVPYEVLVRDNPVVDLAARAFGAVDAGSRLTIFKRFITREAERTGVPATKLLQDNEAVAAARRHVEQFHYDYSNVPLAVQWADKHFVLPFTQFAYKSFGTALDTLATAPQVQKAGLATDQLNYANMSEEDRLRMDNQPTRTLGRMVPLTDDTAIDMRYMTPYSMPTDMLSLKPREAYDTLQYDKSAEFGGSGLPSFALNVVNNTDPMTGRELNGIGDHAANAARFLMPGEYYHVKEKVLPALGATRDPQTGELTYTDFRGRTLSPFQGISQSLGIRLEQDDPGKVYDQRERSLSVHMNKLRERMKAELERARSDKEVEAIEHKYQLLAEDAQEAFQASTGKRR